MRPWAHGDGDGEQAREEAGARIRLSGRRGEQRPCQRPCAGCAAGGGEARRGRGEDRRRVIAATGAGLLGMLLPQWSPPPPLGFLQPFPHPTPPKRTIYNILLPSSKRFLPL